MKFVSDEVMLSDGSTVRADAVEAQADVERRALRAAIEQNRQQNALNTGKTCPIKSMDGCLSECKRDCALFCGDSCAMAARRGLKDTLNMPCPFLRKCVASCALYGANGCSLTNMTFA